jgi:O-antigen/teichoic acid export membrane protein
MPSTKNGVIWSAIERFCVQGVSFLLTLVIARLVTPNEYGLIAMLSIFMAVAQTFIDSGFGNALIQKKDRTEVDYSTVFYFNSAVAILLYLVLFACSPLIADFYNQPELTYVTRLVGLNLILMSLSIIQRTRLCIELDFKSQTKVSLISVIISGAVGIITAYKGWGVWALVIQSLVNNFLQTVLLWFVAHWHPLLVFSKESFRTLFAFGSKLLVSGLLHTIYLNLYSLVIGKFYNASDVGYYNRAYSISQYPSTNIVVILTRAIYPVQCGHQDDDEWLVTTFVSYLRIACFIVFPLMCLLAIIAEPLVLVVLTEKWLPAATLISILSIAYMWYPILVINNQMLKVKGRSDLFLRAEIIKKIVAVGILIATIPWGVAWLCIGVVIYNLFDMWLIIWYVRKLLPLGYRMQFKALLPIFTLTTLASIGSYFAMVVSSYWLDSTSNLNLILHIALGSVFFAIIYLGCGKVWNLNEIHLIEQLLNKFKQ